LIFYNIRQISEKSLIFVIARHGSLFFRQYLYDIIPQTAAKATNRVVKERFIMSNIIKKVAKQNGVSVKEVRKDLEEMIKVGTTSTGSKAIVCWSQFGGKAPTTEQFISALSKTVVART
jgi:hypothetical protein